MAIFNSYVKLPEGNCVNCLKGWGMPWNDKWGPLRTQPDSHIMTAPRSIHENETVFPRGQFRWNFSWNIWNWPHWEAHQNTIVLLIFRPSGPVARCAIPACLWRPSSRNCGFLCAWHLGQNWGPTWYADFDYSYLCLCWKPSNCWGKQKLNTFEGTPWSRDGYSSLCVMLFHVCVWPATGSPLPLGSVFLYSAAPNWNRSARRWTHILFQNSYTLWWTYKKLLKMAIEIVDFPIKNCDFPWQNVSSPEGRCKNRVLRTF